MPNTKKNDQATSLTDLTWLGGVAETPAVKPKKHKKEYDLSPIPLDQLMFSAKIDYIRIETPGHCELPSFHGVRKWGVAAHYKELTLHDATPDDIVLLMQVFGRRARILALEVAVDLRLKGQMSGDGRTKLLERVMIDLFARCLEPSRGKGMLNKYRAFFRRGAKTGQPFERRLPRPTDQLLYGHRDEAVQTKCYFKMGDQGIDLPEADHVARVEVRLDTSTLQNHSLNALEDLGTFDFRKALMPYFAHVQGVVLIADRKSKVTGPLRDVNRAGLNRYASDFWKNYGVGGFLEDGFGGYLRHRIRFVQFTDVNNRIGQALMRLGRQHVKNSVCLR